MALVAHCLCVKHKKSRALLFERLFYCYFWFIGGSNGVGRAFHGALANHPKVSVLHLNNWTLIIAGISTILCPILTYDYATLIAYSAIFGFFVGMYTNNHLLTILEMMDEFLMSLLN